MELNTFCAAGDAQAQMPADGVCVVIDVLRMTSVAVTAAAMGARAIRILADEGEARLEAAQTGALLGGERKGLKLEGFAFGNSPSEYTCEAVAGKEIVLTTSNGARAVEKALGARRVVLCSLMNVSQVARAIENEEKAVILCAGTQDRFSLDDILCAGALAARLPGARRDDLTYAAQALYEANRESLGAFLSGAKHVRYLREIGFGQDVELCLAEDAFSCVPELCADGRFRAAGSGKTLPDLPRI